MDIDLEKPYGKLPKFLCKALSNREVCITYSNYKLYV